MGTGLRNEHSRSKSGREAHGDVGSMLNRKDTSDGSKKIWKRIRAEEENRSQAGWSWGITREACRVVALAFLTWSLSPPSTQLSSTSTHSWSESHRYSPPGQTQSLWQSKSGPFPCGRSLGLCLSQLLPGMRALSPRAAETWKRDTELSFARCPCSLAAEGGGGLMPPSWCGFPADFISKPTMPKAVSRSGLRFLTKS